MMTTKKISSFKRKIISVFLSVAFLFLGVPRSHAADSGDSPAPVLTFRSFYERVLKYYPKLKQQDANVDLAIARKLQAVSGFLPSIQLNGSINHGDDPMFVFGSLMRENRFTSQDMNISRLNTPGAHTSYGASVTGQFPLFDSLQTISRVRSAKLQIDSAQYEDAFTKMEAFLLAAESYLKTVAIEKQLGVVLEVLQACEEDVKQAEDLKDKGLILGADFYTAKVTFGNISQLKNQLIQEKQAAHILLNILMGEDPFAAFEIKEPGASVAPETKTRQAWIEAGYQSRPDLAALDKTIQSQGIEVTREKATALPRIDAFGEARQDTANFDSDGGRNFLVGVKAQVDLFDPSFSSRVRMSKATLSKLEYDRTTLKDSITRDLSNEFAYYQTTLDNLPVIQKTLEDAKQAVDLMFPLYREGRKSIADLLAIRFAYLNTARGFYALSTDAKASWTRLLFLSGQLDEPNINDAVAKIGE